jgi:glyoxylase-like metal-dependent hydrolase (beta-lactamase superfamily II)
MRLFYANNASAWTGPTGNNTYLLPGRVPALIDAGVGNAAHVASVESALAGQSLARVLITHGHPDHAGGLDAILSKWPSADMVRFGYPATIVTPATHACRSYPRPDTRRIMFASSTKLPATCTAATSFAPADRSSSPQARVVICGSISIR